MKITIDTSRIQEMFETNHPLVAMMASEGVIDVSEPLATGKVHYVRKLPHEKLKTGRKPNPNKPPMTAAERQRAHRARKAGVDQ